MGIIEVKSTLTEIKQKRKPSLDRLKSRWRWQDWINELEGRIKEFAQPEQKWKL